jgi:Protein of unknown function (DUF3040)
MSLPARQQQALDKIDRALQSADPKLKSMFAIFTRLTSREAMPTTEAIVAKLPRPMVMISIMVVTVLSAVLLSVLAAGTECPRLSSDQVVASAAVRLAACRDSTAAWSKGGR